MRTDVLDGSWRRHRREARGFGLAGEVASTVSMEGFIFDPRALREKHQEFETQQTGFRITTNHHHKAKTHEYM
jgi:hypothetical protein